MPHNSSSMNNLAQRLLTGLLLATLAVSVLIWSEYGMLIFGCFVSTLAVWEFTALTHITRPQYRYTALIVSILIWILEAFNLPFQNLLFLAVPVLGLFLLADKQTEDPIGTVAKTVFAIAYCLLPLLLFHKISIIHNNEYSWHIPLGIQFLSSLMDTGAYFTGRMFGKTPLAPRISPKKTWEGVIGAGILTAIAGYCLHIYAPIPVGNWLIITAIIIVLNQPGDLIESVFKRSVQIKDSSSIFPGHGGMLDRFDSMLTIIPVVYVYLTLVK
ncbi:MAG: phosphatidate cytidylyltransferase [Bacteroidia bacterium]